MLSKISNTICIVPIDIFAFLIEANSGLAIKVGTFLIDNGNDNNNYKKNQEDWIYQKIIKKSASLFLVNSVYKHIGFTLFQLSYFIIFIITFARITNSNSFIIYIFMICTSTSTFIIFLSKKLLYVFFFSQKNICHHLNHLNYQQQHFYYLYLHQHFHCSPK